MKRMAIILSVIICSIAVGDALTERELKDQISLLAEIRMLKMEVAEKDQEISKLEKQLESEKKKAELYKSLYNKRSDKRSVSVLPGIDPELKREMEKKRTAYEKEMKEKQQRERALRSQAQARAKTHLERLDYMKLDDYYNKYNPRYAGYPRSYVYPRYSRSSNGSYAHPQSFYYGY